MKCQEKFPKFKNPHLFYNEIEEKEKAFKLIATKIDEESKNAKEENKKRVASVSPFQVVKTKIYQDKKLQSRKISYQVGDNLEPQRINLNPIKINMRKRK